MSTEIESHSNDDLYNLNRFVEAQHLNYEQALLEVRSGHKRTHWMWYVFPQFEGLALSAKSQHYSIKSLEEARAYLAHPILGPRLIDCAEALMQIEGKSALEILDSPDDHKLKSCATLFAHILPQRSLFEQLLEKYFEGERDDSTLKLLGLGTATDLLP